MGKAMKRRVTDLLGIFGSVLSLSAGSAIACTCAGWLPYLDMADVAFTGRIVSKMEPTDNNGVRQLTRWLFAVENRLKGAVPREVTLETDPGNSCENVLFDLNRRYQVYATRDPVRGSLKTDRCAGTAQLCLGELQLPEPSTIKLTDQDRPSPRTFEEWCAQEERGHFSK